MGRLKIEKVWKTQNFFVSLYHNLKIKNMNCLNKIVKKITELENESFEGWTQEEINGYLTACITIKKIVEQEIRTEKLDKMDE